MTYLLRATALLFALGFCLSPKLLAQQTSNDAITHSEHDMSVAVIPFVNLTGEPGDDWIGVGIAESIAATLEARDDLRVIALTRNEVNHDVSSDNSKAALQSARNQDASYLISGTYQRTGERIRITGRYVEVVNATVLGSAKIDGLLADLFDLQDNVVEQLVGQTQRTRSPTASVDPRPQDVGVDTGPERSPDGAPVAYSSPVAEGPFIDGDVLNDSAYENALPVTGFFQNTPDDGQPASERTEVRILYTEDTLYFGIVCYVRDPSTIIVTDSRRDSQMRETDSFQIILDTYQDEQTGFIFGTTPAGIEYDGQLTNVGQGSGRGGGARPGQRSGSRLQRGSGGGFNLNWDGVWQVSTRISEIGWTAEIAIPFRTLRYPSDEVQTWGINFQRNIRTRNEQSYWSPVPRQFDLNRLSFAGELQGLAVPPQRNLKLTPYMLGEAVRHNLDTRTVMFGEFGGDLKYSVTPSMTLDLTYNTDFAQVEVDDHQINLDRFNLFFPEKRPFFLENAGLFSVGQPSQIEVFFSRRIGISEDGGQIPLIGGGRLSGKVGRNTNIGLLNMQTASLSGSPANNFTVARVRQDFVNRSNIGAIVVNRSASGHLASEHDFNRSYAVDGRLGFGQNGTISGFAAETETPGVRSDTHAYNAQLNYRSERWRIDSGYSEVGPNFNPEVGFYARRGYRRMDGGVRGTLRPTNSWGIHELSPHVNHFTNFNFRTGQQETQYTHIDNHTEWRSGHRLSTAVNVTKEGVLEPFEIYPGVNVPIGTYDHAEGQVRFYTNLAAPFSFEVFQLIGGFFGGERFQSRASFSMRATETFNAEISVERNDITLPSGPFKTHLGRLRLNYSFTTRMFVQALVQYNDRLNLWSSNIRFGLLSDANTGFFVVYNDIRYFEDILNSRFTRPTGSGRTLALKYSHVFDVLQ